MRRFKGFTLTELMVALAVIGILVAVVTPAIMKNRPNKNKMMVKKTFYATEQIVNSLINDDILYPDMREACRVGAQPSDEDYIYCAWGFDYVYEADQEGDIYEGENKFGALFKSRLNVSRNSGQQSGEGPNGQDFYPVFFTSDGVKWDLTDTIDAWDSEKDRVGTFDDQDANTAGVGTILIDVNGDEGPDQVCTNDEGTEDCDQYEIQILANGKLRINPDHARAVNWATINTSIRDN